MPISSAATPGVYASSSELIALVLLTFKLDGYADLRVVNNSVDITSRGQVFEAVGFKIQLVNQDSEKLPSVTLQIDNLDDRVIEYIRALPEAPRMLMEVVSSADNFQTPEQRIDFLRLVSVNYNALIITGQLVLDNYLGARFPAGDYTPTEFPALFGIAGAGTYAYGTPAHGTAILFDCPVKADTGTADVSDYRRNVQLLGGSAVETDGNAHGIVIGKSGSDRKWMMAHAIYVPHTGFVVEFDLQMISPMAIPPSGENYMGIFEVPLCGYDHTGKRESSLGQNAGYKQPLQMYVRRGTNGQMQAVLRYANARDKELAIAFQPNHRTTFNIKVTPTLVSMMADMLEAVSPSGEKTIDITSEFPDGFYYRPAIYSWGRAAAHEDAGEWRAIMSRMLVTSNDPDVVARTIGTHPTKSMVKYLLKFNDVTDGKRFTDSGYYNYGDMPITQGDPTIQRSGLHLWDGYGFARTPDDQTNDHKAVLATASNLNFGALQDDFCLEFYAGPHDIRGGNTNVIGAEVRGALLIEGAAWQGASFSMNTTITPDWNETSGDVVQCPAILPFPTGYAEIGYQVFQAVGESKPYTYHTLGTSSVDLRAFGPFFIHHALLRENGRLLYLIDGFIVWEVALPDHTFFSTTALQQIMLNGKIECYRLCVKHSVYGAKEFIPFYDEFPDATALPPGTEEGGGGS